MPTVARDKVFISYSRKDKAWLEKLRIMLKPLVRKGAIEVWDDTSIKAGGRWREEIENALAAARVAVLLVGPNFLDSDFIAERELPPLLNAAKKQGLVILWIYVGECLYEETEIKDYQAAHDISQPLDALNESQQNKVLKEICQKIWDKELDDTLLRAGKVALSGLGDIGKTKTARISSRPHASWEQVRSGGLQILKRIRAGNWRHQVTLGIGRSGTIVAAAIATNARWMPPDYAFTTLDRTWRDERDPGSIVFSKLPPKLIKDKNVLLVDSELYSGGTLNAALQEVRKYKPKSIRTAVLFPLRKMCSRPDYYGHIISAVTSMPWEWSPELKDSLGWFRKRKYGQQGNRRRNKSSSRATSE